MAIANLTQEVSLVDSDFLGLPVQHHIADNGYWYIYHPSDLDSNNVLAGNAIEAYKWDSALHIDPTYYLSASDPTYAANDGTHAFITETWDGVTKRYHGGAIQHIGTGVNDITGTSENDAFMFAHIGTFGDDNTSATSPAGGSLEDDAFYWDRMYQRSAGDEWEYYQYHKHLPSNYSKYDDGRIVFGSDGFIRPADKQYGYLINILAKQGQNAYSVPLARIHTPSVGGAHNSHNDVTLPNQAGINYLPGGILKGSSNRFHAFYLEDANNADSEWNIYSRTYTSSSGSFTAQVNYGAYDIKVPNFDPYPGANENAEGTQNDYTFSISAGHTFGSYVYWPVTMKAVTRSWAVETVVPGGQNVYRIDGTDRQEPGTLDATTNHPTIRLKVGDTIVFDVADDYLVHPLYVKTNSQSNTNNQAPGASGNGTATVTFTPQSAGTFYYVCVVHSGMYGQIEVTDLEGTGDLKIWRVTDANTISPGSLTQIDMPWPFQGTDVTPSALITSVGSNGYIAAAGGTGGGAQMYSFASQLDSGGQLVFQGDIVTNPADQYLRIHGFKYNAENTKYYALLSGNDGVGTYSGDGLYSWDLAGGTFAGYAHLDIDPSSLGFVNRGNNTSGYLSYNNATGVITRDGSNTEPEGIPNGVNILTWDDASPLFYNRKEINTGSTEYYFQGIYLSDGRKALVGRVEDAPGNTGNELSGDLILTIVDNENNSVSYSYGLDGDDFVTGIIEDVENNKLILSGYAKGELADKSKQWVHGWARNLNQSYDSAAMSFESIMRDNNGDYLVAGYDSINGDTILAKWDKDFTYQGSNYLSIGGQEDHPVKILHDESTGDRYVVGYTYNGPSPYSYGLIVKINSSNVVQWSKRYGLGSQYVKPTAAELISRNGTTYIVSFFQTSSSDVANYISGALISFDTNGNQLQSRSLSGFTTDTSMFVNSITAGGADTGKFFISGSAARLDAPAVARTPAWAFCDINDPQLIKYIRYIDYDNFGTADQQTYDDYEAAWLDVKLIKYDSDLSTHEIILGGKKEDVSLADGAEATALAPMGERGHASIALLQKAKIADSAAYSVDVMWSKEITTGKGYMEEINSVLVEDSDSRPWWFFEDEEFHDGNHRVIFAGTGLNLDSTAGTLMRADTLIGGVNTNDGSLYFHSSLGHMGEDNINKDMVWDHLTRNFVIVGSSTSHSVGKDGVLFRGEKEGWGQGVYHTAASTSNAYYYDSATISAVNETALEVHKREISNPSFLDTNFIETSLTSTLPTRTYNTLEYNGSYGANGLFTGFMAIVDKDDLQSFLNTDAYREEKAAGKIIHRAESVFEIHQVSTVGDATADDGNVFFYDVIKSSDGEYYYLAGQTSGNIAKQNTGLSGVYDYFLGQWDIASKEFRFWQNGTADDEEIYALTELEGTSKAVTNPEAVNNGAFKGTISWTPTTAGTYYYQCGNHTAMNGQIVVQDVVGTSSTFDVTAAYDNAPSAFRFSGTDRVGNINPATDNPTLTIDTNDTINIAVDNRGHPLWIQSETGTGGAKKGHIAFTGRTTGNLANGTLFGGYDIFLGIFDPRAWGAEYYNIGSGFNDKGMNIHDINSTIPNTLAITYTSFGSVNNALTFGSEDIGLITFNYDSDTWSQGYQTGSETSEEIEQNGKPSSRLPDGRIGVVCNTAGAFADDANTFGLKDMGLGIFEFDSDGSGNYLGWKKYQVGSGSSDFSYSIDNNGSSFLITGYSEATWDKDVSGVFVEFDPERNIKGKASGT